MNIRYCYMRLGATTQRWCAGGERIELRPGCSPAEVGAAAAAPAPPPHAAVTAAAVEERSAAAVAEAPHTAADTRVSLPVCQYTASGNAAETLTSCDTRALQLGGEGRADADAVEIAGWGKKRQRSSVHTCDSPAAAEDCRRGRAEYDAGLVVPGIKHHGEVVEIE